MIFVAIACSLLPQEEKEKQQKPIQSELAALHFKRTLRVLAIVQDVSDAALAANDLRGGACSCAETALTVVSVLDQIWLCTMERNRAAMSGLRKSGDPARQEAVILPMLMTVSLANVQMARADSATPSSSPCWACCQPASARTRTGRATETAWVE